MREIRAFVSSPADVEHERRRAARVIERLNGQYNGVVRLIPIRWEQKFYEARASFQEQIPEASSCDLVIGILWSRLGSELPPTMPSMASGEPYPSGTAYEVLTAIERSKEIGQPSVYLFRKTAPAVLPIEDEAKRALVIEQLDRLKAFWERWIRTKEGHFKAGYQEFTNPDQFEAQLEALLRDWLDERVLKGRAVLWPIDTKGSPFRGLAAFGAKHTPVFFGRGQDTTRAVEAMKDASERNQPFLLLIGSSGCGKSSLARAGLCTRLTTPGVVGTVDEWRVALMRPGENKREPTLALSTHLFDGPKDIPADEEGRSSALPELCKSSHTTPNRLSKALASGDAASVIWALDHIAEKAREMEGDRPIRANLLLIVDQLDELFAPDLSEASREAFAKALEALTATGRVWVVATLRADLYERFQQTPTLLALKQNGAAYDLAPPGAAELAEIVRKPAEAADLTFERDTKTGKSLDEQVLEDAGRPDMLPLLQFALQELFERREVKGADTLLTYAAYSDIGGLDGAIEQRAERALAELGEAEQASLPQLLRQLAVPAREKGEGAALTIRSVALAEAASDEPSRRLVQALIDARILLSTGDEGTPSVRLAHERVLRSWGRARDVVRDNADFYRIRDDVEDQFARWRAAKKSNDLLIPSGLALEEARKLVAGYGAELDPDTRSYVEISLAEDDKRVRARRLRYRVASAAAVLFAVLAIGAMISGVLAWQAEQRSTALLGDLSYLISGVTPEQREEAEKQFSASTISKVVDAVYLVGRVKGTFEQAVATAWAFAPNMLATNAHVAEAIEGNEGDFFLVAPNGQRIKIKRVASHPGYRALQNYKAILVPMSKFTRLDATSGYDVGVIEIDSATPLPADSAIGQPVTLELASSKELTGLARGMPVASVGFPLESGGPASSLPTVRFGNIGSLKDVLLCPADPDHRFILQHIIPAIGGSSGSPMINSSGKVIGIVSGRSVHFFGPILEPSLSKEAGSVEGALVNFAHRADLLNDLIEGGAWDRAHEQKYWTEAATRCPPGS